MPNDINKWVTPTIFNDQGAGNPTIANKSWNQWNMYKITSFSNTTGMTTEILAGGAEIAGEFLPKAIINSSRPNNIGVGTWNRTIAAEASETASQFGKVSKVFKRAGFVGIGIDVGFGIYDNVQAGSPAEKVVSDVAVDTAFSIGGLAASAGGGAIAGTFIPIPIVGTVIGGIIGAIVYMTVTEVWEPGGKSIKDRAKDGAYDELTSMLYNK